MIINTPYVPIIVNTTEESQTLTELLNYCRIPIFIGLTLIIIVMLINLKEIIKK